MMRMHQKSHRSPCGRFPARILACLVSMVVGLSSCVPSEPPEGIERHACYPNGTCNDGLTCLSDLCVRLPEADALPET